MTVALRPYQELAVEEFNRFVAAGKQRAAAILPTGTGKTVLGLEIARRYGKRMLWLAHRQELIDQPFEALQDVWPGADVGIVKADRDDKDAKDVVIASIQTVSRSRCERLKACGEFGLVVVDEVHHAVASSYVNVIDAAGCMVRGGPVMLGLTATPDRAGLKDLFHQVIFDYPLRKAIEEGYLCPLGETKQIRVPDLDLSKVRTAKGDFIQSQLGDAMLSSHVSEFTAKGVKNLAPGRRTIVFTVLVEQARLTSKWLNDLGVKSEMVCGETPPKERREILDKFYDGEIDVVCNASVLCLDEETEILTDRGWTGIDEMTSNHAVANFNPESGGVFFEPPVEIIRRDRLAGEEMISLDTTRRSLRVTGGHQMLYRTTEGGRWLKAEARQLTQRVISLPVSTVSGPSGLTAIQEPEPDDRRKRRLVTAASYNLRQREGFDHDASVLEAERRVGRRYSLRRKNPSDLTMDECRLIGLWLGDGSRTVLQSGGVQFTIRQDQKQPAMVAILDDLLLRVGLDFVRHERQAAVEWSLSRGTGGGSQERNGLYGIEPYLDRSVPDLFWGLNEKQVDALVEGQWLANGNHGRYGKVNPNAGRWICGARRTMLDRLQALLVVRGYRATLSTSDNHGHPLYRLSFTKTDEHRVTKYRLQVEEGWKAERVWCVKTTSKNIITRRRGTVTFMGNCEGYDNPRVDCIVVARPTKSAILYRQMIGRGLRPHPDKQNLMVIDLVDVSNRFDIMGATKFGREIANQGRASAGRGDGAGREPGSHYNGLFNVDDAKPREGEEEEQRQLECTSLAEPPKPPEAINWISAQESHKRNGWFASTNEGIVCVFKAKISYEVEWIVAVGGDRKKKQFHRLIGRFTSDKFAFGAGADAVRKMAGGRVFATNLYPNWRAEPPTVEQERMLRALGALVPKTKGEASDSITVNLGVRYGREIATMMRDRSQGRPALWLKDYQALGPGR